MRGLNWVYKDREYSLETDRGTAIITEIADSASMDVIGASDRYRYAPSLKLADGVVTPSEPLPEFDDFETAESWLLFSLLAPMDSSAERSEALQFCADLLAASHDDPTHLVRLNQVARILGLSELTVAESQEMAHRESPDLSLTWEQKKGVYSTQTPFGEARIQEKKSLNRLHFGNTYQYTPRLVHETGAQLRGPEFRLFESAEEWIQSQLLLLANPVDENIDLDCISFTLDICIGRLPNNSDPLDYVRIHEIQSLVSDRLL